jgi:hypothetical protein
VAYTLLFIFILSMITNCGVLWYEKGRFFSWRQIHINEWNGYLRLGLAQGSKSFRSIFHPLNIFEVTTFWYFGTSPWTHFFFLGRHPRTLPSRTR